jgi:hypothetical protein
VPVATKEATVWVVPAVNFTVLGALMVRTLIVLEEPTVTVVAEEAIVTLLYVLFPLPKLYATVPSLPITMVEPPASKVVHPTEPSSQDLDIVQVPFLIYRERALVTAELNPPLEKVRL